MPTSLTTYSVFFQAQYGPDNDGQGTTPAVFSSGNEPSSSLQATGLDATNPVDARVQANGVGLHGTIIDGTLHADGGVNEPAPPPGNPGAYNAGNAIFNASFSDALTVTQPVYVTFTPVFLGSYMGDATTGFLFRVGDTAMAGSFIYDSGTYYPNSPYHPPAQTFILYPGHTYATSMTLEVQVSGIAQEAEVSPGSATDFTAGFTVTELDAVEQVVPGNPHLVFDSGFRHDAVVAPCFAEGTRIRTERGEVAVESLRPGDMVPTACGQPHRIEWIGHRHVDCRRHPRPHDVWPVRLSANAIAPGAPCRDLLLSPDHAVLMAGVLIPVRYLVNGATIAQQRVDAVTYWHVKLARHGILLAEALACESYLETGNRPAFAATRKLHPTVGNGLPAAPAAA